MWLSFLVQGFIRMALPSPLFYGLWVDCETRRMLSGPCGCTTPHKADVCAPQLTAETRHGLPAHRGRSVSWKHDTTMSGTFSAPFFWVLSAHMWPFNPKEVWSSMAEGLLCRRKEIFITKVRCSLLAHTHLLQAYAKDLLIPQMLLN